MEINNELRRVREKLKLWEEAGLTSLLSDLIQLINEDKEGGSGDWTEEGKQWLINQLKEKYKKYIRDNTEDNPKQQKLF